MAAIQLTYKEIHAAIQEYVQKHYDAVPLSSKIHLEWNRYDADITGATVQIEGKK